MYVITVNHSNIVISNYKLGDCPKLEKYLSIWDPSAYQYLPVAYSYDNEKSELRIPRGINVNYIEKMLDETSMVNYTPDPYEKVSIKLKPPPKNDDQRNAVSFLIGEN